MVAALKASVMSAEMAAPRPPASDGQMDHGQV